MHVDVRNLRKRFGDVEALRGVDFEIPPGRRVALVGPNGSGKSTLNRVLLGLLSFEGQVRLDGRSPLEDRLETARRVAYVPQNPPGLAAPVAELVAALARVRGIEPARVEAVAARLDLPLAPLAGRPFRGLSGGMKQKLLIALALAAEPELLVLDEPTGSLDAAARERFFPLVAEQPAERSVLLCSHRLEEVRQLVDHVLMLADGRIVYDGPAADFLDATSSGLVEVCVPDGAGARWLAERGFRRGAGDWWVRVVRRAEKRELLAALMKDLGGLVRDVNVRDLERLEVEPPDAGGPAAAGGGGGGDG